MKLIYVVPLLLALPQAAFATAANGVLVGGGGVDDMQVVVQTIDGRKVSAYCDNNCGDWFEEGDDTEVFTLKKEFKGKKVVLQYAVEPNRDRVVGPTHDEPLPFVKHLQFQR